MIWKYERFKIPNFYLNAQLIRPGESIWFELGYNQIINWVSLLNAYQDPLQIIQTVKQIS